MPKAADFSAIYGIRHIASGRIYVGSAVRTNARWNWQTPKRPPQLPVLQPESGLRNSVIPPVRFHLSTHNRHIPVSSPPL